MKCFAASVVPTTSIGPLDYSWRRWQTWGQRVSFRMGVCHELPKHYLGCWAECPSDYGLPPASPKTFCSIRSLLSAFSCLWKYHVLRMVLHFVLRWPVGVLNFVLFYCCHYHMVPTFAWTRGSTPDTASFWFDDGDSYCAGDSKLTGFHYR